MNGFKKIVALEVGVPKRPYQEWK